MGAIDDFEDDIPFGENEEKEKEQNKEILSSMSDTDKKKAIRKLVGEQKLWERISKDDLVTTDIGNAELFRNNYGLKLSYCGQWNTWLIWNGKKWEEDMTGQVQEWGKQCMKDLYDVAFDGRDIKMRNWAFKSASKSKIDAFIRLAQSEYSIPRRPKDFDSLPMIINLDNGIYDLKEGRLELQLSDKYCSKIAGVYYDPDVECPIWYDFLEKIMDGNTELISFLQRACGYSLSGDTREQCFFVLQGPGANGKSTFVTAISNILGDYAGQLRSETLIAQRFDQIPSDIARMKGKRFVSVQETPQGCRLNEGLIKQLTGQDRITARMLYQNEFEYVPQFKIWLSTNHKPRITGRDLAIWRRIHLIPFNVIIPEPEQDKELLTKLMEEASGIFNWMIEGFRMWKEYGLLVPKQVQAATNEYRNDEDILASFIAEKCERFGIIRSSILYDAYKDWAEENGEKKKSNTWLGKQLRERGFDSIRKEKGIEWQELSTKIM